VLAADPTAAEGLLLGLAVPRTRLVVETLGRIGEPLEGPAIFLTDEIALRLDLALVVPR
jgi:hypothetical protein